jgi:hypothetical protein
MTLKEFEIDINKFIIVLVKNFEFYHQDDGISILPIYREWLYYISKDDYEAYEKHEKSPSRTTRVFTFEVIYNNDDKYLLEFIKFYKNDIDKFALRVPQNVIATMRKVEEDEEEYSYLFRNLFKDLSKKK